MLQGILAARYVLISAAAFCLRGARCSYWRLPAATRTTPPEPHEHHEAGRRAREPLRTARDRGRSRPREAAATRGLLRIRARGGDTLLLRHVNAAFNCCPGEITAEISISNDTITIVERESQPGCHCLCLYDLEYRFENIEAGTYTIIFIEPYTNRSGRTAARDDRSVRLSLGHLLRRTHRRIRGAPEAPRSRMECSCRRTDCTLREARPRRRNSTFPATCRAPIGRYSGAERVLVLDHINAAFNCCPGDIGADIRIAERHDHDRRARGAVDVRLQLSLHAVFRDPESRAALVHDPIRRALRAARRRAPGIPGGPRGHSEGSGLRVPAALSLGIPGHDGGGQGEARRHAQGDPRAHRHALRAAGTANAGTSGSAPSRAAGVWEYLIYSTATVDTALLKYLVSQIQRVQRGLQPAL